MRNILKRNGGGQLIKGLKSEGINFSFKEGRRCYLFVFFVFKDKLFQGETHPKITLAETELQKTVSRGTEKTPGFPR